MKQIKTLLTGTAFLLFLSSCGGGGSDGGGLKTEVCDRFREYKSCARRADANNFLECDKTYEERMMELSAENAEALIPVREGFDYNAVRNTLNECVLNVEENPLDELKKCLFDFQDSVLDGLKCDEDEG